MTLHNQALLNMDTKPSEGFEKLAFLLQQPSFPPVTFANLLLLYCKYEVGSPARRRTPSRVMSSTFLCLRRFFWLASSSLCETGLSLVASRTS